MHQNFSISFYFIYFTHNNPLIKYFFSQISAVDIVLCRLLSSPPMYSNYLSTYSYRSIYLLIYCTPFWYNYTTTFLPYVTINSEKTPSSTFTPAVSPAPVSTTGSMDPQKRSSYVSHNSVDISLLFIS